MDGTPIRLLARHFARQFLDNDLISPGEDQHVVLASLMGGVIVVGAFTTWLLFMKYSPPYPMELAVKLAMAVGDKAMFIGLAMGLMALVTVASWDSLFLDRRDFVNLGHLPIAPRALLLAKLAALAAFVVVLAGAFSVPTAVLLPLIVLATEPVSTTYGVRAIAAELAGTFTGCGFAFLTVVAIRSALIRGFGDRLSRLVLPVVQFLLVLALLAGLLLAPWLSSAAGPAVECGSALIYWWPPLWFLGVTEMLWGRPEAVFGDLARVGGMALVVSAIAALVSYALAYVRGVSRLRETLTTVIASQPRLLTRVLRMVGRIASRDPLARASFDFTVCAMARNPRQRLCVAGYLGAGVAISAANLAMIAGQLGRQAFETPLPAVMATQMTLLFFLIAGVRVAATLPAELRANWVFQMTARPEIGRYLAGARRAVLAVFIGPLLLFMLPLHGVLWGWRVAGIHFAFGLAMGLGLTTALFARFQAIPFTCAYAPGRTNLKVRAPLYALGYWIFVYPPIALEHLALQDPETFRVLGVLFGLAMAGLLIHQWWWSRRAPAPVFDVDPDASVQTLGLMD